jgi:hypothetical protein
MEKHVKGVEVHFAYNDTLNNIQDYGLPKDWILHTYTDNTLWSERVNKVLREIDCEYILFIHEDWLPTGDITGERWDEMTKFMTTNNVDFLLSYSHLCTIGGQTGIETGYTDYYFFKEPSHVFQPAIWRKSVFDEFTRVLNKAKNQNEDHDCLDFMSKRNCMSVQNERTVRQFCTTNSLFFPHMHALSQNCWHFIKYPTLKALIESYGIDTSTRGIHTWWCLDTQ